MEQNDLGKHCSSISCVFQDDVIYVHYWLYLNVIENLELAITVIFSNM